jgi:hypothetical protein
MLRKRPLARGLRTALPALFLACGIFGCDSDGPTGPKPASLSELFGNDLRRADGTSVGIQALDNTPIIGIYFADPGCPACGGFTPLLVEAYDQLRRDGRPFEVVLITLGISDSTLYEYMTDSGMPWLAVSPVSSKAYALVERYNVRWIPTLIVIDDEGATVSTSGREEITQSGAGAYDAWLAASSGG